MVADRNRVEVRREVVVVDVVPTGDELRVGSDDGVVADREAAARVEHAPPADLRVRADVEPLDAEHCRAGEDDATGLEGRPERTQPPPAQMTRRQVRAVPVEENLPERANKLGLARLL